MASPRGFEPRLLAVKGRCPRPLDDGDYGYRRMVDGGGNRDRTDDLLHAMQALSQLSYTPTNEARIIAARRAIRNRQSRSVTPPLACRVDLSCKVFM